MLFVVALVGCGQAHEPDAQLGQACSAGVRCTEGLACILDGRFPEGYCTTPCPEGSCPAGGTCDTSTTPALCLAECASADDCREGYQCWRGRCGPVCAADGECSIPGATCGADGRCVGPECASSAECGAAQRCAEGRCVPLPPDGGLDLPLGAACDRDFDCESRICLESALGGVCTRECTQAVDCFDIGDAGCSPVSMDTNGDGVADTVRALCAPLPSGSRTMGRACTRDEECEARVCQQGQCTEVCDDDGDCLRGQTCTTLPRAGVPGASYLGCGYSSRTGAVQIDTFELGEQELAAGRITPLELALPPDAVSLTMQARRVSGDPLELTFVTVIDPTDTTVFDVAQILELVDQPLRWLPIDTGESITALLPNSTPDRLAFVPGRHRWSVATIPRSGDDRGSARVRMSAQVKRAGAPIIGGAIDLNVFLVGIGVSAAAAPTHTRLQGSLARFDAILGAEAGVRLGDVAYFEITGSDATRYQIIDSTDGETSELAELFRLSAPHAGRRLSVFLVQSIAGGGSGFRALGIAGGIPGPVAEPGTQHSGVVVAFDSSVVGTGTTGANVVGHVLAHETGHYLGLFHGSEQSRPCGPGESPSTSDCAPFGAGDTLADTTRGDTTNLMYWSIVGSGSNDQLSAGQAFVVRVSALVRP